MPRILAFAFLYSSSSKAPDLYRASSFLISSDTEGDWLCSADVLSLFMDATMSHVIRGLTKSESQKKASQLLPLSWAISAILVANMAKKERIVSARPDTDQYWLRVLKPTANTAIPNPNRKYTPREYFFDFSDLLRSVMIPLYQNIFKPLHQRRVQRAQSKRLFLSLKPSILPIPKSQESNSPVKHFCPVGALNHQ